MGRVPVVHSRLDFASKWQVASFILVWQNGPILVTFPALRSPDLTGSSGG